MISQDGKELRLVTEIGVPNQLRAVQRILQTLGIADDAMFLSVLSASCVSVDPLHLWRMFRDGTLQVQGGTPEQMRICDTLLVLPVVLADVMVGEIYVSLITNDLSCAWRHYIETEEQGDAPEMEFFPEQISAQEVFEWLTNTTATVQDRLPAVQAMINDIADIVINAYNKQQTLPVQVLHPKAKETKS